MSERFFLTTPPRDGRAILEGDEARHCSRVLRAKLGDMISVFDGHGTEWPARVAGISRDAVTLDLGEPRPAEPAPPIRLTLAVALPKGERQKWLVEKVTELGVTRLVPLITERGVAEATGGARARLERGVIEACKQCGRNTLMEIAAPATLGELAARHPTSLRLIAHPGGGPLGDQPIAAPGLEILEIVAAIGPEGGFSPEEFQLATAAGFLPVSLGTHILRIETAAIAVAAWKRLSIA
ncbi:MAG: RsmE family RNA methyltransferase [Planctomycetia bacterium]